MKPSLVDRVIGWASPEAGVRRAKARAQLAVLGGYDAGDQASRTLRGWITRAVSPNDDILPGLPQMRANSRDLVRNNPWAGGAIHTIVNRTVGTGLSPQVRPNLAVLGWTEDRGREWKRLVETEFALWAERGTASLDERLTFYGLQDLVFRSALESGDAFSLLPMVEAPGSPYRLRVQVVEADRVANPPGVLDTDSSLAGVRVDPATGAVTAVYVHDKYPTALLSSRGGRWIDVRGPDGYPAVLHHMRVTRPGQVRGVPHLAPVVAALKQLSRYAEAELMAAVVSSLFTVFVTGPKPEDVAPLSQAGTTSGGDSVQDMRLEPGAIIGLGDGEGVQFADPNRPNTSFDPFVQAVLRQIAVGLELPFEVLVKHFQSSYSASRAALLDAAVFFRGRRGWLRETFCQPVYEAWLAESVALGRVAAPGFFRDPLLRAAYCRCDWTGDTFGSLDPVKEIAAVEKAVSLNIGTRERAEMELYGTDWWSSQEQRRREAEEIGSMPGQPMQAPPLPVDLHKDPNA